MSINNNRSIQPEPMEEQKSGSMFFPVMLAVLTGLFLAFIILPSWLPSLVNSTMGSDPKAFWYLSRSTAIISYTLLWISMVLGVTMTGKLAQHLLGVPMHFDLHLFISILGLGFSLVHGLLLMGDAYIAFSLSQVLVPFTSVNYLPFYVGLGQVAFYMWGIIILSHYVRKLTGRKVWRAIHYSGYVTFLMALVHGLTSGTDGGTGWAFYMYWISAGVLTFLVMYRILVHRFGLTKVAQAARD